MVTATEEVMVTAMEEVMVIAMEMRVIRIGMPTWKVEKNLSEQDKITYIYMYRVSKESLMYMFEQLFAVGNSFYF